MKYKNIVIIPLLVIFNCFGLVTSTTKQQPSPRKKIDTGIKWDVTTEILLNAIQRNDAQELIDLVEKNKVDIKEIDNTYGLVTRAFLGFLKDEAKDLFIFIYLLILGAEYSNSTAQVISSLVKKHNGPKFTSTFQPILETLTDFKNAQNDTEKATALNTIIRLSVLNNYLESNKAQTLYELVSSHFGTEYVPQSFAYEFKQPSEISEFDEPAKLSEELVFPDVPDEDFIDWVFVPTKEEEKAAFKELLKGGDLNPEEEWEWIDEK